MKLVIQIPCHNEREALPVTLKALPREVPGFTHVEWLIIDDGSSDGTADVARAGGVDHVVRLPARRGLASAFVEGLSRCFEVGADVVVNLDADNQYCADDIPLLTGPVLEGTADIVIGARPISATAHFGAVKKLLQRLGSLVVRLASGTDVADAPSGFRAFSRRAIMQINVFDRYTYTLETIIQAGHRNMTVLSVPIRTNPDLRPSRLVSSIPGYVVRSMNTIARMLLTYRPFRLFAVAAAVLFLAGVLLGLRFLAHYMAGTGTGMVQSLILAALLMGSGFYLAVVGILADLISVNRRLLEDVKWRLLRLQEKVDGGR